jgi:hypothetical protein
VPSKHSFLVTLLPITEASSASLLLLEKKVLIRLNEGKVVALKEVAPIKMFG